MALAVRKHTAANIHQQIMLFLSIYDNLFLLQKVQKHHAKTGLMHEGFVRTVLLNRTIFDRMLFRPLERFFGIPTKGNSRQLGQENLAVVDE